MCKKIANISSAVRGDSHNLKQVQWLSLQAKVHIGNRG